MLREGVINTQRGGGLYWIFTPSRILRKSLRLYFSSKKSLRKLLRFYFYEKNPFKNCFVSISMIKNPFKNPFVCISPVKKSLRKSLCLYFSNKLYVLRSMYVEWWRRGCQYVTLSPLDTNYPKADLNFKTTLILEYERI